MPVRAIATFAADLATRVGRWLERERLRRRTLGARSKAVGDPVTDLDIAGERRLRAAIRRRWPEHGFLGEETGGADLGRDFVWIVDPIDGTANFAAGLAPWGVSVACLHRGLPLVGAVHAVPEGVTMHAIHGRGAYLGRRRITIADTPLGPDSILSVNWFRAAENLAFVTALVRTGARVRVHGSTVVQLLDVARGRMAANIQQQGKVWDFAAAGLIVQEAGGLFGDWAGRPLFPCPPERWADHHASIAAAPGVARGLIRRLRGCAER